MTACSIVQAREQAKKLLELDDLSSKRPPWAALESCDSFSPWLAVSSSNARYATSQAQRIRPKNVGGGGDSNTEQSRAAAAAASESLMWFLGITTTAYHYSNNNGCYRQYKLQGEKGLPTRNTMSKGESGKNSATAAEQAASDRDKASNKLINNNGETPVTSNSFSGSPAEIFSEAVVSKPQLSTKSDNLFGNSLQKYSLIEQPIIKKLSFSNLAAEGTPFRDSLFGGGGSVAENVDTTTHQIFAKIRKGSLMSSGKLVSTRDLMNFKPDNQIRIVNSNPALSTLNTRAVLSPLRESTHLSLQEMPVDGKESNRPRLHDSESNPSDQYLSFVANPDSLWHVNKGTRKKKASSKDHFEDPALLLKDGSAILTSSSFNNHRAAVLSSRLADVDAVSAFDVLPDTPLNNSGNRLGLATADFYATDALLPPDPTFMDDVSFIAKPNSSDVLPMKSSRSFQVSTVKHEKLEPVFLDAMLPEISGRRVPVGQSSRRIL